MKNRNLNRMCLVLVLVLALGSTCVPAGLAENDDAIGAIVDGMTLRDKLAQMMFVSPRTWKDDPESEEDAEKIRTLNDTLRSFLAERRFGGVVLFADNCGDAEQTLRLTAEIQAATLQGSGLPMLIAADQEGGTVARLGFGTSGIGAMALAATGDPENARAMAKVFGEELTLVGINVDFAPDADVNDNPSNPVIGDRSFGDDANAVGKFAAAYVQGLHDAGAIATAKHFPGHGNTDTDSHTGLPLVNRTHDELMANELVPFKAAIEAGVDMVMTAHIQFPQVETQTYTSVTSGEQVYIPATMSKVVLTDILRDELGFEGVIVSDALEMSAIWDNYAMDDVLTMTINAGVNVLLLSTIRDAGMLSQIDAMLDRAEELAEAGQIDVSRVDDSVRRILALKQKYGLLDATDFAITDDEVDAAVKGCGSGEHRQLAWDLACKALTLLRNGNDAFPMEVKPGERTLILFSAASRAGAGDLAASLLAEAGTLPEGAEIESMVVEPETADACVEAAKAADHVILVSRAWAADCLDPATENGYPVGVFNRIIGNLHDAGKTAVVVSCQLPYDAACYPEADALLLTFCSGAMRSLPAETGEGSAWVPSLPAALCACFGGIEPTGSLPVKLLQLGANGSPVA